MSSKNSKLGSTRSRAIFEKRNGAYVVARDEGKVTRICWLHVVKGDPLQNFVAEPDRARDLLEAAITDVTSITDVAADVAAITDVIEDTNDLPGLRSDLTDYDSSMQRVLKDALER
jgi:hypothetical protein